MFICKDYINVFKWVSAYSLVWLPLFLSPALGWIYFLLICCLTLASRTKGRVAGRTGSTYEDMSITGLEEAEKREDKWGATAASPSSVWKENTFLSRSLPVWRLSLFEWGRGDRHRHGDTHIRHLIKVVGLKRAYSHNVKWHKILLSYCEYSLGITSIFDDFACQCRK